MRKLAQPQYTEKEIYEALHLTHLVAKIEHVYYDDLVRYIGEPSIIHESGDGKTQVEWVFKYKDSAFSIYDWKTYDRDYTLQELTRWHIGGTPTYRQEFIDELQSIIKKPTRIL